MPGLELCELTKVYGARTVVNRLQLHVAPGEFFCLLGPSGCGKTTTLRMIAGLEKPTSGSVVLNGCDLNPIPPYRRPVTTVFQSYALFPHLTAQANIEFGLRRHKLSSSEIAQRVSSIVGLLNLHGKEHQKPAELSGGERQRVALARSLVLRPEVLLLDEPLAALDPNLRVQLRAELKALQRQTGTTFVFITHDREEALSLPDRIGVLRDGRLQQIGSPEELYRSPSSQFVAEFLGPLNWFDGAAVRPEQTVLSRQAPPPEMRGISAEVRQVFYFGSHLQVHLQTDNGARVSLEVPRERNEVGPGDRVYLHWRPQHELTLSAN
jgi:ABC-type Fe3+/spermidine/putrescine transport system ATPase subunit